ncbi:MAG: c-type cytochrome [Gammaproteobacteria bacterium]
MSRSSKNLKKWLVILTASAGSLSLAGFAVLYSGVYDVAATKQHSALLYWILDRGLRSSVRQRAGAISVPALSDSALIESGFRCYRDHCVQCHGAPGIARDDLGKGLLPLPNNLVQTAREWPPAELYWVSKYGIRMTGMPAWGYRLADHELWAIVAFLKQMPLLAPKDYRAFSETISGPCGLLEAKPVRRPSEDSMPLAALPSGDPLRGPVALRQYACTACHRIPGVTGPSAHVGPPLEGIARRKYLAGIIPNNAENMIRWIRDPQAVSPSTAMPDLDVKQSDARDMAAYLFTLE